MELEKAIQILTMCYEGKFDGDLQDHKDAVELSIEALKFMKEHYNDKFLRIHLRLSGETEE